MAFANHRIQEVKPVLGKDVPTARSLIEQMLRDIVPEDERADFESYLRKERPELGVLLTLCESIDDIGRDASSAADVGRALVQQQEMLSEDIHGAVLGYQNHCRTIEKRLENARLENWAAEIPALRESIEACEKRVDDWTADRLRVIDTLSGAMGHGGRIAELEAKVTALSENVVSLGTLINDSMKRIELLAMLLHDVVGGLNHGVAQGRARDLAAGVPHV